MLLILCVAFSLCLLVMLKYIYHDLAPGKIFSLFWIGQILLLTIGGYSFLIFKYTGIIFILVCLLCFNIGPMSVQTESMADYVEERKCYISFHERRLLSLLVFLIVLGFYNPIQTIVSHGFSLSSLLDFSSLLKVNNSLSVSRYTENTSNGLFTQFFLIFSYTAPLLGGFCLPALASKKGKWICCASLLPLLFAGLTQGVKMCIITSILVFISGYYVSCILLGKKIIIKTSTIIKFVLGIVVLFAVLLLSMMFRIGRFDLSTFYVVTDKFVAYAFGHLPAFDLWFDKQPWISDTLTYGAKMFLGITNFLGILKREQGLYSEFVTISNGGAVTNVYTIFRIFIDDFGIILVPIVFFFLGVLIQRVYRRLLQLLNYRINSMICVSFLFMTFWSFVTSVFVYTSYICMFAAFYFILCFCTQKVDKENE
uniref:O-antigen polymerase n=1 Tax=Prevotella sp. TaxID=59823 RepID=UPI00257FAAFB